MYLNWKKKEKINIIFKWKPAVKVFIKFRINNSIYSYITGNS
jgi:hypothetical protein